MKYYSQAIDVNPVNAIYYGNRSLAYLRTECYGYALADATKAIELDKKYIKGYYRRATSNMALGKFKAALRDYETVSGKWCGWLDWERVSPTSSEEGGDVGLHGVKWQRLGALFNICKYSISLPELCGHPYNPSPGPLAWAEDLWQKQSLISLAPRRGVGEKRWESLMDSTYCFLTFSASQCQARRDTLLPKSFIMNLWERNSVLCRKSPIGDLVIGVSSSKYGPVEPMFRCLCLRDSWPNFRLCITGLKTASLFFAMLPCRISD